ncbi:MAG: acyltransferase [Bacteroidota bacterium]
MKFKYIDSLRGLAILGVLIVHCSQYGNQFYSHNVIVKSFFENGARGVQLFFLASAFTLFFSMDNRIKKEKTPIINYFIRRFFRIAPMYYIGIMYYLWQDGLGYRYWLADENSITIGNILSNVFFLHGFNPYWMNSVIIGGWSIAVEMIFYLIVPFLFNKIKNSQQAFVFVVFSLLFRYALNIILTHHQLVPAKWLWEAYLFFYFPSQLPIFSLGILLYFIIKEKYEMKISPLLVLISSAILVLHLQGFEILPQHFLFGISFVLLAIALSEFEFKALVNVVTMSIGKVSYSMYIVHFAVLYWLEKLNFVDYINVTSTFLSVINYGIRLVILIILTVIISNVFYKYIEVPFQTVGKKLIAKINNN